jgi:hypothetical protein
VMDGDTDQQVGWLSIAGVEARSVSLRLQGGSNLLRCTVV